MSIDGDDVGDDLAHLVGAAVSARGRMSLTFEAITSFSIGRPMALGDVAGEDVAEVAGRHDERTARCGAPSATAATK